MTDFSVLSDLLDRSATGDQVAFKHLYKLAAPYLYALAIKILRDATAAEDVLQEAFLQIWKDAQNYNSDKGTTIAWMAGIARNRALDTLRRLKSHNRTLQAVESEPEPEPFVDPKADAQLSEETRRLLNCLQPIQAEQRNSIMMAYFQGLSYQQVADSAGAPIGTVKSWIRRGLWALRECMQQ